MATPRLSVLLSVYNAEAFLRDAVDSLLGQTLSDFELLVFEDGSTDSSRELLRAYRDARLVLIENRENVGLTQNLIRGMQMARGEFVARMDADDISLPYRFEQQVHFLRTHPNISVVGSSVIFFDSHGSAFPGYQPVHHDEIKCELLYGFTLLHPTVMLRRADFLRSGLNYDPHFRCSQDHDLWVRASRKLQLANIREPLLRMREHPGKIGRTAAHRQIALSHEIRQRQLDELGTQYTDEELSAFNLGGAGPSDLFLPQLTAYDRVLAKIFASNRIMKIFDQPALETIGAAKLRALCRTALLAGNASGRFYWRSKARAFDRIGARDLLGMAYRSILPR